MKTQLVFDVGGVVLTNLYPAYWDDLSILYGVPLKELRERYRQEVREAFWNGAISEKDYLAWFRKLKPDIVDEAHRRLVANHLKPLPAYNRIADWSKSADIHILSNHRWEWIGPMLKPIQSYLTSVTVSSEVGCSKPESRIYDIVHQILDPNRPIVFVDDQENNFKAAQELGWITVLADVDGEWKSVVESFVRGGEIYG